MRGEASTISGIALDVDLAKGSIQMDERVDTTIPALLSSLFDDVRKLLREELQLAKLEIRQEALGLASAGAAAAIAAVLGVIGIVLLSVAVGSALAYFFRFAVWIGYGIVAVFLLIVAGAFLLYARARARAIRPLPKTVAEMKENFVTYMRP